MRPGPLDGYGRSPVGGRSLAVLAVLEFTVCTGYLFQGLVHHVWGLSLLGILIPGVSVFCGWHAVASGCISTNLGTFARQQRPFAFWFTVTLCFAVSAALLVAMFLAHPFSAT